MTNEDFKDIAPFDDSEVQQAMNTLVKEPGFEHAVRYVMPDVDYDKFCAQLCQLRTKYEFQKAVIVPFLDGVLNRSTDGITVSGLDDNMDGKAFTYISNHRDIVLDAAFLNYLLATRDLPTTEIAIGDNLLVFDWIDNLVRLNKSFIVRRGLRMTQALEASKHLSAYIRHTVTERNQSVWIAQREGRAKDSNDVTQESLLKMLGQLSGEGTLLENIMALNIAPVSITYEYDPNDYLKAREFLLRRRDPEFHKSQRDDLLSMETGMLGYKGHVHYTFNDCINPKIAHLAASTERIEVLHGIREAIDNAIHAGYEIFKMNYIAYDQLNETDRFADQYSFDDIVDFDNYISAQLDKVDVDDITEEEDMFMREMMLQMYANPLANKLVAIGEDSEENDD